MSQPNPSSRKNLRLPGHDYSLPGFYFVTICTNDRRCLLGQIREFSMNLSEIGSITQSCWLSLPDWFSNVALDQFILMPNHLHAILEIKGPEHSLRSIIGSFKSAATRHGNRGHLLPGRELWQRGYFDHIVRSEKSLFCLRQYILDNPVQWHLDELNPDRHPSKAMRGIATTRG